MRRTCHCRFLFYNKRTTKISVQYESIMYHDAITSSHRIMEANVFLKVNFQKLNTGFQSTILLILHLNPIGDVSIDDS